MLDDSQELRQLAEGISSTLKDEEREGYRKVAAEFLGILHDFGCDDATACKVARLITRLMGALQITPLQNVSEVIDANLTSYAFASAGAAGVFALPDREPEGAAPEEAPDAGTGMYL